VIDVKVGDKVTRWLAGTVPMPLLVTEVTPDLIICGAWTFDPVTGAEIDPEIGWGVRDATGIIQTGSVLAVGDGTPACRVMRSEE